MCSLELTCLSDFVNLHYLLAGHSETSDKGSHTEHSAFMRTARRLSLKSRKSSSSSRQAHGSTPPASPQWS